MPAQGRLHIDGDPLDASSETIKKGLKGSDFGIHKTRPTHSAGAVVAATRHDGHPDVSTGDAGVEVDGRVTLDSDRRPLGTDYAITAPATFTVATGAGAANTLEATAADEAGDVEVVLFERDADDTDVDGPLIGKFDIEASGAAVAIDLDDLVPAVSYAGETIVAYARRLTTDGVPGPYFATRRTVAVHS